MNLRNVIVNSWNNFSMMVIFLFWSINTKTLTFLCKQLSLLYGCLLRMNPWCVLCNVWLCTYHSSKIVRNTHLPWATTRLHIALPKYECFAVGFLKSFEPSPSWLHSQGKQFHRFSSVGLLWGAHRTHWSGSASHARTGKSYKVLNP